LQAPGKGGRWKENPERGEVKPLKTNWPRSIKRKVLTQKIRRRGARKVVKNGGVGGLMGNSNSWQSGRKGRRKGQKKKRVTIAIRGQSVGQTKKDR